MLRIFDKPAGITTHTSLSQDERRRLATDPVDSFLGHLAMRSGLQLWPVHRLDLGTTGVLLAADNADEAAELSRAFEARDVEKTYYFLTDRKSSQASATEPTRVESYIDRQNGGRGSNFFSYEGTPEHPVNAITTFEFVRDVTTGRETYALWSAKPLTGRPHQIRLHAESLGIPILGDGEHGGSRFPAICLHAAHVRLEWKGRTVEASAPLPRWFDDLTLLTAPGGFRFINWLASIERRERLQRSLKAVDVESSETMRWIHAEGDDLRADQLGDIFHFHWYGDHFTKDDQDDISELARVMGWQNWYIQTRANRGRQPTEAQVILSRPDLPERWSAREDGITFNFRRDTSMSSGLFLDQRANRRWLRRNAVREGQGLRVLNLFSYTSGFSVAAAKGGATKVVSVDLSKNFLAWSKENFMANGLSVEDSAFEFRAMEARDYLKWAKKKGLEFDIVVCDPPSFARTDAGVFRIETALEDLMQLCLDVTAAKGRVLFSTNFELMDEAELFDRASELSRRNSRPTRVSRPPSPDFDFEFPREKRMMKCFFLDVLP